MNQPDEHDDLWKLLGKARPPAVSPFFARNVVREVRGLHQEQPGFFATLRRRWQLTLATAAAGCVIAAVASQFIVNPLSQSRMVNKHKTNYLAFT